VRHQALAPATPDGKKLHMGTTITIAEELLAKAQELTCRKVEEKGQLIESRPLVV
jgi:hypothetical protein